MSDETTGRRGAARKVHVRPSAARTQSAGSTNWDRLRGMADAEIEAGARSDPENPPAPAGWLAGGAVKEPSPKVPISLRVDPDVLAWFKATSVKYQSRMNAVLRAYMEHHQAQAAAPRRRAGRKG